MCRAASNDLVQLLLVGFCFSMARVMECLGLSSELGAILAGVCISVAASGVYRGDCSSLSLASVCIRVAASGVFTAGSHP